MCMHICAALLYIILYSAVKPLHATTIARSKPLLIQEKELLYRISKIFSNTSPHDPGVCSLEKVVTEQVGGTVAREIR